MDVTERKRIGLDHLNAKLNFLIDAFYTPVGSDPGAEAFIGSITEFQGAVFYAYSMGDIDSARRLVLLDQASDLLEDVKKKYEKKG